MILKGFKKNSNKKHLDKILLNREVNILDGKIESLGVIINIDEINDFQRFRDLAKELNIHSNNVKIIAFNNNRKENPNFWDTCFNEKDLGWNGSIKNVELQSFIETNFDVLISYYTDDILELKLITAKSQAQFKIGILQSDSRVNDLIININLNDFKVFKNELFKYLTILKKIKNE